MAGGFTLKQYQFNSLNSSIGLLAEVYKVTNSIKSDCATTDLQIPLQRTVVAGAGMFSFRLLQARNI